MGWAIQIWAVEKIVENLGRSRDLLWVGGVEKWDYIKGRIWLWNFWDQEELGVLER